MTALNAPRPLLLLQEGRATTASSGLRPRVVNLLAKENRRRPPDHSDSDHADLYVLQPATDNSGLATDGQPQPGANTATARPVLVQVEHFEPQRPPSSLQFMVKQAWEGTVTLVTQSTFHADLRPLNGSGVCEETAEIELDEVDPDDMQLVLPGAVFYWYIGYRTDERGTRRLVMELRFRRLPVWTSSEIARVQEASRDYDDFFDSEEPEPTTSTE